MPNLAYSLKTMLRPWKFQGLTVSKVKIKKLAKKIILVENLLFSEKIIVYIIFLSEDDFFSEKST